MLAHAFAHVALVEFRVGDTNYRSRNALEASDDETGSRWQVDELTNRGFRRQFIRQREMRFGQF